MTFSNDSHPVNEPPVSIFSILNELKSAQTVCNYKNSPSLLRNLDFLCQSDHDVNPPPQSCAGMWCSLSLLLLLHRAQMDAACVQLLLAATLWMVPHIGAAAAVLSSSAELLNTTRAGAETRPDFRTLAGAVGAPRSRRKRAISSREINALLDYHNRVRSQVFPPAANMEFMVRKHWALTRTRLVVCFFSFQIQM